VADTNCKNCGAPVTGPRCEYCGTQTRSLRDISKGICGKTLHCCYEEEGEKVEFDILVESMELSFDCETFWNDGAPYYTSMPTSHWLEICGRVRNDW